MIRHHSLVALPQPSEEEPTHEISAEAFAQAVLRSGMTKSQVANLLGVHRTQVYNYLQAGVSNQRRIEVVRRVLGLWLRDEAENPFDGFSDQQLVQELQRRLDERR